MNSIPTRVQAAPPKMHFYQGSARKFIVELTNLYEKEELKGMKRSDLQDLAKLHGIKANMKTVDLEKALARVAGSNLDKIMAEIGSNIQIQLAKSKICIPTRVEAAPLKLQLHVFQASELIFILEASSLYKKEDLAWMKRSELQRLAKHYGFKTDMKTDRLIKALAAVVVGSNLEGNNIVPAVASSEEEATTTSASSTEDQTDGLIAAVVVGSNLEGNNIVPAVASSEEEATTTSASSTEDQTSSVKEEEVSPVAKKSKAKPKGRKRSRRGRQTKEEPMDEPMDKKKKEQVVAPVAAVVFSPAVEGRRSRSLPRTSAVSEPTLPTPPNSGSRGSTRKRSASGSAGGKAKKVRRVMFDESPAQEVLIQVAGKLKPFGETQQNSPSHLSKAKALMKKPQLKGRDVGRAGSVKHGAQKRKDSYMANRGIRGC